MPHLIIESTQVLDHQKLKEMHQEAGRQESIKIENLKTRLFISSDALVAENEASEHIAITLKLLAGRSEELKKRMSENLIKKANELFPNMKLSVEVIELGLYLKN